MRSLLKVVACLVGVGALFVLGYSWRNLQRGEPVPASALRAMVGLAVDASQPLSPTELYKKTFKKIRADYYRKVDAGRLKYAGMEGLMASLGDPHTAFLDPVSSSEFSFETKGEFVGVGARLSPDPLGAKVISVFESGPAYKAGLKGGDVITGVDGKSVAGKVIDAIVKRIRGTEGTVVKLQVIRAGSAGPLAIPIRRAAVTTPTVEAKVVPGTHVGYMSISQFAEHTTEQFDAGIAKLEKARITGLVIDLRGNPGGLLETAVEMLSRFVENKVVVKMKFRDDKEREQPSEPGFLHNFRYPIVVLVNEDSASAAEIFSGVLRDYKLATLVGEHTYGKASVQEVSKFDDHASAKITIARYYLPSGDDIGRRVDEDGQYLSGGIEPDVQVPLDYDLIPVFGDIKTDNQLQKAVQVLKSKS